MQNILASASEDSFDNGAHLTGSSVCATMSSSVDSSSLATTVAPNQAGVSVQSFGFQSPVVVSQFTHGPPPLVHASVYPLRPTSGDLLPSSDTENPSQRPSPSTGQTPPGSHLGTGWMQGAYFRPSETPRTWPTVHPSLQASTHTLFSRVPTCREARNVYYHPWRTCISPHFKAFIPSQHINVDREILNKFVDCHHAHIEREFGLSFQ